MSKGKRTQTRLAYTANLTLAHAKTILSLYWKPCVAFAALFSFVMVILALSEPPRYRAVSTLKVRTFNISKTLNNDQLKDNDIVEVRDLLERQLTLSQTSEFASEVHKLVNSTPNLEDLHLTWGIGERFRLGLLLGNLSIAQPKIKGANLKQLNGVELVALFMSITSIQPNYLNGTIGIQVDGLDQKTSESVARLLAEAHVAVSESLEKKAITESVNFLRAHKDSAKLRLTEVEDRLASFYSDNPNFSTEASRNIASGEYGLLSAEVQKKSDEIKSNQKLLDFYRTKFAAVPKNSDITTEVVDKFKKELVELKYRKKKFLFQGYAPDHEGILELDEKITTIEKILRSNKDVSAQQIISVDHEERVSTKIMELQDLIKKQEIEMQALKKRMEASVAVAKAMPEQELLHSDLEREVRIARELFESLSKRLELASIRLSSPEGILSLAPIPITSSVVKSLPTAKRVVFSFIVGLFLASGFALLFSVAKQLVIDETSVEGMGLKFAGNLLPSNSNKAKVLLNLGCSFKQEAVAEPPIILCSSPGKNTVSQVLALTEHLSKQKEKSLLITVGSFDVSNHFELKSDLGYAKVFCAADGAQFILQIMDEETLYSVREFLAITREHYKVQYSMIFLYIDSGLESLLYPFGQQIADKMLIVGPVGKHAAGEYFRLIDGFKNFEEVYVALTNVPKDAKKVWPFKKHSAHNVSASV